MNKFRLKDYKPVSILLAVNKKLKNKDKSELANKALYRQLVNSLLYLIATRPDIMFAASLISRFMHNLTKKHFGTTKKVLKYIQGTLDYGVEHVKGKEEC